MKKYTQDLVNGKFYEVNDKPQRMSDEKWDELSAKWWGANEHALTTTDKVTFGCLAFVFAYIVAQFIRVLF